MNDDNNKKNNDLKLDTQDILYHIEVSSGWLCDLGGGDGG